MHNFSILIKSNGIEPELLFIDEKLSFNHVETYVGQLGTGNRKVISSQVSAIVRTQTH